MTPPGFTEVPISGGDQTVEVVVGVGPEVTRRLIRPTYRSFTNNLFVYPEIMKGGP